MTTHAKLANLPLTIDSYELEGLDRDVSSAFTRATTVIHMLGAGHEGAGEDVTYDTVDHIAQQEAGPNLPLAGEWTLDSFSAHLANLDLFPVKPERDSSHNFRRWGFESAALDLALRQMGDSLAGLLGIEPKPVRFVVSLRLSEPAAQNEADSPKPASIMPLRKRLDLYPDLRFKLDPTVDWTQELIDELAATGAVDAVDFKAYYRGTPVDQPVDPDLYGRVIAAFPEAWIEDPAIRDDTRAILAGHEARITWDAPIHSVADIEDRPFKPRMVNIKPSRFGPVKALMDAYDYCAANGIGAYGGGQFELGPGRGQIQYLASLFHPDAPNDVAPGGYNEPEPKPGLPSSPLEPQLAETGFRWRE